MITHGRLVSRILNIDMQVVFDSDKDMYTVSIPQTNPLIKTKVHTYNHEQMQRLADLLQVHDYQE